MNDTHELNAFEQALLTELRQAASERSAAPPRRSRKRWAFTGGGIMAAAAAILSASLLGSAGAYAVEETAGGDIVVTIHELSDAQGLEEALAERGVTAEVDYWDGSSGAATPPMLLEPPATPRDDGIYVDFSGSAAEFTEGDQEPGALVGDPCGNERRRPFSTRMQGDDLVITIPAGSALLQSDSILRVTTAGSMQAGVGSLSVSYSVGAVECGFASETRPERPPSGE